MEKVTRTERKYNICENEALKCPIKMVSRPYAICVHHQVFNSIVPNEVTETKFNIILANIKNILQ